MEKMMRLASFVLVLGAISLFGFGCKSPQAKLEERLRNAKILTEDGTPAQAEEYPPLDLEGDADFSANPTSEVIYLREVMRNLGRAETFHAEVDVPVQGGEADLTVDFNKSIGMYGRLRIDVDNELSISDVFLSNDELFFRANTSTWTDISGTEQGEVLKAVFQRATLPSEGAENFVSEYAQMQEQTEDGSGCTLYAFKQYNVIRARVELYQICVDNNYPRYIVTESPFGSQRIEYSNINGFVDVVRP